MTNYSVDRYNLDCTVEQQSTKEVYKNFSGDPTSITDYIIDRIIGQLTTTHTDTTKIQFILSPIFDRHTEASKIKKGYNLIHPNIELDITTKTTTNPEPVTTYTVRIADT